MGNIQQWHYSTQLYVFALMSSVLLADRLSGKTPLVKALLKLKNGENDTVKYLLDIAEDMGDLEPFVNAAYIDSYYFGKPLSISFKRLI